MDSEHPTEASTTDSTAAIEVLHVDDDPLVADLVAELLTWADDRIRVTTTTDPTAVPELVAEGSFDCVVSDHEMPELTGLELLEYLRRRHPRLPFVLFTGVEDPEVGVETLVASATDYCRKGTSPEQYRLLAARVVGVVERRGRGRSTTGDGPSPGAEGGTGLRADADTEPGPRTDAWSRSIGPSSPRKEP